MSLPTITMFAYITTNSNDKCRGASHYNLWLVFGDSIETEGPFLFYFRIIDFSKIVIMAQNKIKKIHNTKSGKYKLFFHLL